MGASHTLSLVPGQSLLPAEAVMQWHHHSIISIFFRAILWYIRWRKRASEILHQSVSGTSLTMEHCQGRWIVKSCPWEGQVTQLHIHSYTHKWVASDYVLPSIFIEKQGFSLLYNRNPPSPMTFHRNYGWFRKTPGGLGVQQRVQVELSGVGSFAGSWLEHPPYLWLMFPSQNLHFSGILNGWCWLMFQLINERSTHFFLWLMFHL